MLLLVRLKKVQTRISKNCMNMHGSFKMCGLLACLPWVELVFNEKGTQMHKVHYMVCTFVERKKNLSDPKPNNLLKH